MVNRVAEEGSVWAWLRSCSKRAIERRAANARGYSKPMTGRPRRGDAMEPVVRLPELDQYEGQWVATKHGRVVAHATSSRELAKRVRELGADGEDAVAEFVAPPSATWVVGVG